MTLRAGGRRCAAALLLCWHCAQPAAAQETEPFRTRNLSPLVSIFGVPAWETAPRGTRIGVTSELANHYRLSQRGQELLILDGETWRSSFSLMHAFGEGWNVGVEVPYYQQSGGELDDLIDAWHTAFGMPDGGRDLRPEDELLFVLADRSGPFFRLDRRARGIGDVQLSLGRSFGSGDGSFFLKGAVKLPSGDENILAGSGSTDWSLTLLRSRSLAFRDRPAGFFWGAGVLALGDADVVRFESKSTAWLGLIGGSWKPWRRIGLKAQLDLHSALYDSRLEELGELAIQATLGGWWNVTERSVLEVAVNEDLRVSTSPDLVLHLTLRWSF